ncbi:hypothetical protein EVAR_75514_1 [Eumeta japonica]|uniref:Uncharacterized protein n=1 Tax=Eumeta variegata TaxID=151549 RepID=A0A4C1UK83_EUMVA|nr:hypothetical protein EVAR_75514_1 [Eumeta japonica]
MTSASLRIERAELSPRAPCDQGRCKTECKRQLISGKLGHRLEGAGKQSRSTWPKPGPALKGGHIGAVRGLKTGCGARVGDTQVYCFTSDNFERVTR